MNNNLSNIVKELNIELKKGEIGDNKKPIVFIKGGYNDTKVITDILKEKGLKTYGLTFNGKYKIWFWFYDNKTMDNFIIPAFKDVIFKLKGEEINIVNDLNFDDENKPTSSTSNVDGDKEKLTKEIDSVITTFSKDNVKSDNIASKRTEEEILKSLQEFKEYITNISDDETFKELMKKILSIKGAQGYDFSLRNSLMILIQNRNATIVNNRTNWLEIYNRTVNENAKPIFLYRPTKGNKMYNSEKEDLIKQFLTNKNLKSADDLNPEQKKELNKFINNEMTSRFIVKMKVNSVDELTPKQKIELQKYLRDKILADKYELRAFYDVSDTTQIEGKEDYIKKAQEANKDIKWYKENELDDNVRPIYEGLLKFAREEKIKVEFNSEEELGGARGSSSDSGVIKLLNNEGNDVGLTKTLAHEITHQLLHNKYLLNRKSKWSVYYRGVKEGRGTVEQQAELSAWMFMHSFGFDFSDTSLTYTMLWGGDENNMPIVFDVVIDSVNKLIRYVNDELKSINENTSEVQLAKPIDEKDILSFLKKQFPDENVVQDYKIALKQTLKENIIKKLIIR
jgi:hypothetical protein